ncbi:hypothetical protein Cadr_000022726 [Camelus dromedarius]|uniref:Uncharacterized protein n=1 Tax=Camelus dromedarius TaxID=9838 RepID=A0A5N4CGS2_CAMDR|nr:hypothetical protein Cadr_000022726 [Camelus dromedarius]
MGQSSIVLAEAPFGGGEKMEHQEALEQEEMQFRGSFWETGAQRWKNRLDIYQPNADLMWEEDAGEEWKAVSDKAEKENKKILF